MGLRQTVEIRRLGDITQIHLNGKDFQVSFDNKILTMSKEGFEMLACACGQNWGKVCAFVGEGRKFENPDMPVSPEESDIDVTQEQHELPVVGRDPLAL